MNMTKASPISSPEERHEDVFVIPLDLSNTPEEDLVEAIPPQQNAPEHIPSDQDAGNG